MRTASCAHAHPFAPSMEARHGTEHARRLGMIGSGNRPRATRPAAAGRSRMGHADGTPGGGAAGLGCGGVAHPPDDPGAPAPERPGGQAPPGRGRPDVLTERRRPWGAPAEQTLSVVWAATHGGHGVPGPGAWHTAHDRGARRASGPALAQGEPLPPAQLGARQRLQAQAATARAALAKHRYALQGAQAPRKATEKGAFQRPCGVRGKRGMDAGRGTVPREYLPQVWAAVRAWGEPLPGWLALLWGHRDPLADRVCPCSLTHVLYTRRSDGHHPHGMGEKP